MEERGGERKQEKDKDSCFPAREDRQTLGLYCLSCVDGYPKTPSHVLLGVSVMCGNGLPVTQSPQTTNYPKTAIFREEFGPPGMESSFPKD